MENTNFNYLTSSDQLTFKVDKGFEVKKDFLVIAQEDVKLDIDFNLSENAIVNTYVLVLATNKANVEINLNSYSNQNQASFFAKVVTLGLSNSQTKIRINSKVDLMTKNNRIDQEIKGILLSNKARITGEPVLVINTEDIMAKHALNIGSLNNEELFYLQSKGLDLPLAKKMIVGGLINKVLESLDEESVEKYRLVVDRLLGENNA